MSRSALSSFALAASMLLLGCMASLGTVRPLPSTRKVVLPQTSTATTVKGLAKVTWVEGLTAGTYVDEAENEDGTFYRGPKDCVILLMAQVAEDYLKSGKLPTHDYKLEHQILYFGEEGGVWVPRAGVPKPMRFYFYFQPKQTSGSGALVDAMINSDRGKLQWGPEVLDKRILETFQGK